MLFIMKGVEWKSLIRQTFIAVLQFVVCLGACSFQETCLIAAEIVRACTLRPVSLSQQLNFVVSKTNKLLNT